MDLSDIIINYTKESAKPEIKLPPLIDLEAQYALKCGEKIVETFAVIGEKCKVLTASPKSHDFMYLVSVSEDVCHGLERHARTSFTRHKLYIDLKCKFLEMNVCTLEAATNIIKSFIDKTSTFQMDAFHANNKKTQAKRMTDEDKLAFLFNAVGTIFMHAKDDNKEVMGLTQEWIFMLGMRWSLLDCTVAMCPSYSSLIKHIKQLSRLKTTTKVMRVIKTAVFRQSDIHQLRMIRLRLSSIFGLQHTLNEELQSGVSKIVQKYSDIMLSVTKANSERHLAQLRLWLQKHLRFTAIKTDDRDFLDRDFLGAARRQSLLRIAANVDGINSVTSESLLQSVSQAIDSSVLLSASTLPVDIVTHIDRHLASLSQQEECFHKLLPVGQTADSLDVDSLFGMFGNVTKSMPDIEKKVIKVSAGEKAGLYFLTKAEQVRDKTETWVSVSVLLTNQRYSDLKVDLQKFNTKSKPKIKRNYLLQICRNLAYFLATIDPSTGSTAKDVFALFTALNTLLSEIIVISASDREMLGNLNRAGDYFVNKAIKSGKESHDVAQQSQANGLLSSWNGLCQTLQFCSSNCEMVAEQEAAFSQLVRNDEKDYDQSIGSFDRIVNDIVDMQSGTAAHASTRSCLLDPVVGKLETLINAMKSTAATSSSSNQSPVLWSDVYKDVEEARALVAFSGVFINAVPPPRNLAEFLSKAFSTENGVQMWQDGVLNVLVPSRSYKLLSIVNAHLEHFTALNLRDVVIRLHKQKQEAHLGSCLELFLSKRLKEYETVLSSDDSKLTYTDIAMRIKEVQRAIGNVYSAHGEATTYGCNNADWISVLDFIDSLCSEVTIKSFSASHCEASFILEKVLGFEPAQAPALQRKVVTLHDCKDQIVENASTFVGRMRVLLLVPHKFLKSGSLYSHYLEFIEKMREFASNPVIKDHTTEEATGLREHWTAAHIYKYYYLMLEEVSETLKNTDDGLASENLQLAFTRLYNRLSSSQFIEQSVSGASWFADCAQQLMMAACENSKKMVPVASSSSAAAVADTMDESTATVFRDIPNDAIAKLLNRVEMHYLSGLLTLMEPIVPARPIKAVDDPVVIVPEDERLAQEQLDVTTKSCRDTFLADMFRKEPIITWEVMYLDIVSFCVYILTPLLVLVFRKLSSIDE